MFGVFRAVLPRSELYLRYGPRVAAEWFCDDDEIYIDISPNVRGLQINKVYAYLSYLL